MCLDHGHFHLVTDNEETPLENVASILPSPEGLTLIDVFGKKKSVTGNISEIDLLNRRIVLA